MVPIRNVISEYFGLFFGAGFVVQLVIVGLFLCSLASWQVIIQKIFEVLPHGKKLREFEDFYVTMRRSGGRALSALSERKDDFGKLVTYSVYSRVRDSIIESPQNLDAGEIKNMLEHNFHISMRKLEAGIPRLATIASSAPFIGLLGTAWGVMNSFSAIGQSKSMSLPVIASGISEALLTTALGLFVALPAYMLYGKFVNTIDYLYSASGYFFDDVSKIMASRPYPRTVNTDRSSI